MGLRCLAFHTRLHCEEIGVEKPEHSLAREVPVPRKWSHFEGRVTWFWGYRHLGLACMWALWMGSWILGAELLVQAHLALCVWGLTSPHGRCLLRLDNGVSGLTDRNIQDRAAIPMISLFPWVLCYMLLTQCRKIGLGNNRVMPIYFHEVWPCYPSFPLTWLPVPPASTHPSICISRR